MFVARARRPSRFLGWRLVPEFRYHNDHQGDHVPCETQDQVGNSELFIRHDEDGCDSYSASHAHPESSLVFHTTISMVKYYIHFVKIVFLSLIVIESQ